MKKEDVFVRIDSEEKRVKAIKILTDARETIWKNSCIFKKRSTGDLILDDGEWIISSVTHGFIIITLEQLEQILNPNYTVKEVHLTADELRMQAEKLGFELVEKKRDVKVGDFGMFSNSKSNGSNSFVFLDFLNGIENERFIDFDGLDWDGFRHLTNEEKQRIQEKW